MLELTIFCELKIVQKENTVLCNFGFSSREPALTPSDFGRDLSAAGRGWPQALWWPRAGARGRQQALGDPLVTLCSPSPVLRAGEDFRGAAGPSGRQVGATEHPV